jgi:hypothetical protein
MARNNLKKLGTRAIYNIAQVSDVVLIRGGDIFNIPKGASFEEVYNFLEMHVGDNVHLRYEDVFGNGQKEYVELTV